MTTQFPLLEERAVGSALERASQDVLETMFFTSFEHSAESAPQWAALPVAARLHFEGGLRGDFQIWLDPAAARGLAQAMLGLDDSELAPEHPAQVAGELANMICGSMLSHLEPDGLLTLTSPAPVENPFEIAGAVRRTFELPEGVLFVECRLQPSPHNTCP